MQKTDGQDLAQIKKVLKEMLVNDLSLEDIRPEDIKDNEILFGEGPRPVFWQPRLVSPHRTTHIRRWDITTG